MSTHPAPTWQHRLQHAFWWLAGAAVLTLVFMAYAHPQLVVELAEQMWACF